METNKKEKYFIWSDAWIFTSLYYSHKSEDVFDLSKIIGACDVLNHSIITINELNTAFAKFLERGLFKLINNRVIYTDLAKLIIEKAEGTKGGLFSRIDITLRRLNSNRIKLPYVEGTNNFQFVTDEEFRIAYLQYKKRN